MNIKDAFWLFRWWNYQVAPKWGIHPDPRRPKMFKDKHKTFREGMEKEVFPLYPDLEECLRIINQALNREQDDE